MKKRLAKNSKNEEIELKKWKIDKKQRIIDFNLTDCRKDLIMRIQCEKYYTLEECKILLKEIVKVVKGNAEIDIKNLMFLSKFRTEKLYPKPILPDYIGEGIGLKGFKDSPLVHDLIYGNGSLGGKGDVGEKGRIHDGQKNEEGGNPGKGRIHDGQKNEEGGNVDGESIHESFREDSSDDEPARYSLNSGVQKLESLVRNINISLIKIIDSSLRQRKERILLAATILKELEDVGVKYE